VGGFVRDLLLGAAAPDLDLVVEGDGIVFARRLAEEIGGTLLVHRGFGTASIEAGRAPAGDGLDGVPLGRVDVASARREHYVTAGALPEVEPTGLIEDLRRRDFTVNAIALVLAPDRFGRLVDPLGGQRDVRGRRLRSLRPLAFVEDPTRVFRAARYAARLRLRPDVATLDGIRLAVERPDYPALSGQRLWHEIELAAAEPRARRAFELLVRWGATNLWNIGRVKAGRLIEAERFARWARLAGVAVDSAELVLLALLIGRPALAVRRALDRLALTGEPRAQLEAAAVASPLASGSERRGSGRARWTNASRRPRRRRCSLPGSAAGLVPGGASSGTWRAGARCVRV
jgi:tRNA nucleotidyltransferase (CCA-adding enzyme)